MIEIKIDKGTCEVKHVATMQEMLEHIRSLDVIRGNLVIHFKEKMTEEILKSKPFLPIEEVRKNVDKLTEEALENISIVSKVIDNDL